MDPTEQPRWLCLQEAACAWPCTTGLLLATSHGSLLVGEGV